MDEWIGGLMDFQSWAAKPGMVSKYATSSRTEGRRSNRNEALPGWPKCHFGFDFP